MLTLMPPADNAQKRHVQHSVRPRLFQTGKQSNMGQISVKKSGLPGSLLSGNQHRVAKPGRPSSSAWLLGLLARKPKKVAAVALANKIARVVWAMMARGEAYRRQPSAA